jgi:general secretion pathway protein J
MSVPACPGGGAARAAGFTLLEILLATALLAAAMALAFSTLRAAGATVQRGEALAERNERIRAVSEFLRRRIGGTQGLVFQTDPSTNVAWRFEGAPDRMRFVADLPDYLGRGGPHLHVLQVARADTGLALQVDFRMVQAGNTVEGSATRPPEPLADGLRNVTFDYRMPPIGDAPGAWVARWQQAGALPRQVRVRISDAHGPWPELVVALPLAAVHAATAENPP